MSKALAASYKSSPRWSASEARAALTAFELSRLSLRAFARREGLDPQRLRAWKQKLDAHGSQSEGPMFVEVAPRMVEHVEVVLPSGVVLRVAATVDPLSLRRIVEALLASAPC